MESYNFIILKSLRRIIRAVDINSQKINATFQITVPQLLCLYSIERNPGLDMSSIAADVNLSASTVNGIVDRLEDKKLVCRRRGTEDRRKVFLDLTEKGRQLVADAPPMLQETLSEKLLSLPELEQAAISLSLEKIVRLMEAEHIDASPNLIPNDALSKEKTGAAMR